MNNNLQTRCKQWVNWNTIDVTGLLQSIHSTIGFTGTYICCHDMSLN